MYACEPRVVCNLNDFTRNAPYPMQQNTTTPAHSKPSTTTTKDVNIIIHL